MAQERPYSAEVTELMGKTGLRTFKILSEHHQSATSEEFEEFAKIFSMERETFSIFQVFEGLAAALGKEPLLLPTFI